MYIRWTFYLAILKMLYPSSLQTEPDISYFIVHEQGLNKSFLERIVNGGYDCPILLAHTHCLAEVLSIREDFEA